MRKLTCVIVDDEPLAVQLLEAFVNRTDFLCLLQSFTDPIEAASFISQNKVDLLFLDIQMPDVNGLELARSLGGKTKIIFTTAFKEFAFDSYEFAAIDYLLKPIRYAKFLQAAERARSWYDAFERGEQAVAEKNDALAPASPQQPSDSVFLRVDGEWRKVDFQRILFVEGMKDYVMFHLEREHRPLITHLTMKAVEQTLPAQLFMRVNRSFVVALDKIRTVDRNMCIYIGEEIIRVTDQYKTAFENYLKSRMPG